MLSNVYRRTGLLLALPGVRWSLGVFLFIRLTLTGMGIILWLAGVVPDQFTRGETHGIELINQGAAGYLIGVWQRHDAYNYMLIVMEGYTEPHLSAFMPLYPLLAKPIAIMLGQGSLAALTGLLVVSNLSALLMFIAF